MKRLILALSVTALAILTGCDRADRVPEIITVPENVSDGDCIWFRKEIDLRSVKDLELKIAADTKYWMWIDGEIAVREGGLKRGPNPTDSYCDIFTEMPSLHKGRNSIAILVQYYGRHSFSHRASAVPGLWFDLKTATDHIVSDSSWRACKDPGLWAPEDENTPGEHQFRLAGANFGCDGAKALEPSSDASAWPSAVTVCRETSDWGEFHSRPIPQFRWSELKEYETIGNLSLPLTLTEPAEIRCALPYNAHVHPYMKISSTQAGRKITIKTDDYWIGSSCSFKGEYLTREGEQEFELPIWINGHEVIYEMPEGVTVESLAWRESGYDADFVGSFRCDDEFYNKLWEKAARTLYVTMRDNYMDCPDRERALWWGDAVLELGEAGYVFDSRAHLLTRKAVQELMAWQRPNGVISSPIPGTYKEELPTQMLASVGWYGFQTYYRLTGDIETMRSVYPGVRKYLFEVWHCHSKGNVEIRHGEWYWGDWGRNIDKEGLQQCWYAVAMKGFAEIARTLGHGSDAMMAEQTIARQRQYFNVTHWKGTYYASKNYEGEPDDRLQAMAVLAGFVPEDRYPMLRDFFRKHYNASPYMEKYVLEALCRMGYHQDALERMHKRFEGMVKSEYSTLWEGWDYTGSGVYRSGNGTYNHAWSGGGLTVLSEFIAGIAPLECGFKTFSLCPNPGSLREISTVVPTEYGNIKMDLDRGDDIMTVNLHVPEGTSVRVDMPAGWDGMKINVAFYRKSTYLEAGDHIIRYFKAENL